MSKLSFIELVRQLSSSYVKNPSIFTPHRGPIWIYHQGAILFRKGACLIGRKHEDHLLPPIKYDHVVRAQ